MIIIVQEYPQWMRLSLNYDSLQLEKHFSERLHLKLTGDLLLSLFNKQLRVFIQGKRRIATLGPLYYKSLGQVVFVVSSFVSNPVALTLEGTKHGFK